MYRIIFISVLFPCLNYFTGINAGNEVHLGPHDEKTSNTTCQCRLDKFLTLLVQRSPIYPSGAMMFCGYEINKLSGEKVKECDDQRLYLCAQVLNSKKGLDTVTKGYYNCKGKCIKNPKYPKDEEAPPVMCDDQGQLDEPRFIPNGKPCVCNRTMMEPDLVKDKTGGSRMMYCGFELNKINKQLACEPYKIYACFTRANVKDKIEQRILGACAGDCIVNPKYTAKEKVPPRICDEEGFEKFDDSDEDSKSTTKKPADDSKSSTTKKPADDSKSSTTKKPADDSKSSTTKKPADDSKSSTTKKPADDSKSSTTKKP